MTILIMGNAILQIPEFQPNNVPLMIILRLLLYPIPYLFDKIYPFIFLITTALLWQKLHKNNELVIMKSFGMTPLHFLLPITGIIIVWTIIYLPFITPIVSYTYNSNQKLYKYYITRQYDNLSILGKYTWLLDKTKNQNTTMIYAQQITENINLHNVTFFITNGEKLLSVYFAQSAKLRSHNWELHHIKKLNFTHNIQATNKAVSHLQFPSSLTPKFIRETVNINNNMASFLSLPSVIKKMKQLGTNSTQALLLFLLYLNTPFLLLFIILVSSYYMLNKIERYQNSVLVYAKILGTGMIITSILYIFNSWLQHQPSISGYIFFVPLFILIPIYYYRLFQDNKG